MADVVLPRRVSPFGNLRINAYLPLPEAYRSLSRPSSAPSAKAFPLRSFLLDLIRLRHRLKRQSAEMVLNHIAVLRIMQASTEVFTNRSDYPFVIPQFACLQRFRAAPSVALLHFFITILCSVFKVQLRSKTRIKCSICSSI